MVRQRGHGDSTEILEKGTVYFIYRPTVETHHPRGLPDVERFHMVLRPEGGRLYRLAVIGRKRLPDVEDNERNWGFIQAVKSTAREAESLLQEERTQTETQGERTYPAARAAGEGAYAFVQQGRSMHLLYCLDVPKKPGPVQKALNIAPEASMIVAVKNPEADAPRNAGLENGQKASYPPEQQRKFADRRFAPSGPELLDFEGAEFILIGADERLPSALDIDLESTLSPRDDGDELSRIYRQLRFARSRHPAERLLKGTWK